MSTRLSTPSNYPALRYYASLVPQGQAIVEIGSYEGASAVALGRGAQEGGGAHVWTIDPHDLEGLRSTTGTGPRPKRPINFSDPIHRIRCQKAIEKAGLEETVSMIQAFSLGAAASWQEPKIGFLFIDGDHRSPAVRKDFAAWEPHLASRAYVAFDDYHPERFPGVIEVVDNLVDKSILEWIGVTGTLAVTRRTR